MIKKKSFTVSMLLAVAVFASTGTAVWGSTEDSEVSTYTKTDFAMDTVVSETLYTTGEDITADVIQALKDIEDNLIFLDKGKFTDLSDQSECRKQRDSLR